MGRCSTWQSRPTSPETPWGSKTPIRSRGESVVLMDEPAQEVPPVDTSGADGNRFRGFGERGREVEPAMGPAAVVVLDIGPERPIQMPRAMPSSQIAQRTGSA